MRARDRWRLTSSLLLLSLAVGCGHPEAAPGKAQPQPPPSSGTKTPSITANPNPVPAGSGLGTTTITWDSGGGWAQIFISENGGADTTMFAQGGRGTLDAPWIRTDHTYEFRLYAGKDHQQSLDKVMVTRAK